MNQFLWYLRSAFDIRLCSGYRGCHFKWSLPILTGPMYLSVILIRLRFLDVVTLIAAPGHFLT